MTRAQEPPSRTELDELVRRLPREVAPPSELWQRIAMRLDTPKPRSLEERARDLPADIAPPVDLWPQIAARMRAEPHLPRGRARFAAAAAALLAVAALVALVVRDELPGTGSGDSTASTAADGRRTDVEPSTAPSTTPGTALGAAWMLRSPLVSDDVAATLRRELTLVRDERLSIEAAIEREPENPALRELWAHTYQIELQLTDACGRTIMAFERG